MDNLNYEEDVQIDHNALDVEWVQQPELMRKYTHHAADTKRDMDNAKERLEVGRAKLDMDIRNNPTKYGLEKTTESAVQSTIILQGEYQKLSRDYTDAKYENDVAMAVVRAVDQRKTALENLVRLLNASYFAGPQSPRDLNHELLEEKKRKDRNAKVKINRKRKDQE